MLKIDKTKAQVKSKTVKIKNIRLEVQKRGNRVIGYIIYPNTANIIIGDLYVGIFPSKKISRGSYTIIYQNKGIKIYNKGANFLII